jgi:hypothetical protein
VEENVLPGMIQVIQCIGPQSEGEVPQDTININDNTSTLKKELL